jgi:hypothetical protein
MDENKATHVAMRDAIADQYADADAEAKRAESRRLESRAWGFEPSPEREQRIRLVAEGKLTGPGDLADAIYQERRDAAIKLGRFSPEKGSAK